MTAAAPEPFYFGPPEARLFGVYDPPRTPADRELAVVVCPPFGREYVLSHRALRLLATRLSRVGFHVLRFDFRGCGDSAGDLETQDLEAWMADVGRAVTAALDRSGLERAALVGLRLGATLALLGAARRPGVEALALWEPTLNGAAYATEIIEADRAERRARAVEETPAREDGITDVFGFPMGAALRRGLEALPLSFARRPARRLLLLRESPRAEDEPVAAALARAGVAVERAPIARARIWVVEEDDEARALVPSQTLQTIVDWLSGSGR